MKRILVSIVLMVNGLCFAEEGLRVWDAGYPRLLFFRNCEGWARADMPPEEFDGYISKAVGMIGKTFNEEMLNTAPGNAKYFSAYKQRHPEQTVLIHFNGLSHDPRYVPETFKAVHWLHHNGCKLAGNLDAAATARSGVSPVR